MTTLSHPFDEAPESLSDPELISAVRHGDTTAVTTLRQRHQHALTRHAATLTNDPTEAHNLIDHTFTDTFTALRNGDGPHLALRTHLHTTLRTLHTTNHPDTTPTTSTNHTPTNTADPHRTTQAFHTLPERWQLVLWHTDIETDTPDTIAPLLGLTPNGVTALAYRARERLRQAYLQTYADEPGFPTECADLAPLFAAEARGDLQESEQDRLAEHLSECSGCRQRHAELAALDTDLAACLAPAILGEAWRAYLGRTEPASRRAAWLGLAAVGARARMAATAALHGVRATAAAVRNAVDRAGARNTAIGAGTVAAVAAATIAAMLLTPGSHSSPEHPNAPAAQPTPSDDSQQPSAGPTDSPSGSPSSSASPSVSATPRTTPSRSPGASPSTSTTPPALPRIEIPDLLPDLTSGKPGSLTVSIAYHGGAAVRAADGYMTLQVRLPSGVRLTGHKAGDGWRCMRTGGGAYCARKAIGTGESTTAQLPLKVDQGTSGKHTVSAAVRMKGQRATRTADVVIADAGDSDAGHRQALRNDLGHRYNRDRRHDRGYGDDRRRGPHRHHGHRGHDRRW